MQFTAKLVQVLPVQSGVSKGGNEWKKQNIIFETDGMYPKKICVAIWGDRVSEWEAMLVEGSMLDVSYDIESREYNGNWYTDVRAWRVEPAGTSAPDSAAQAMNPANPSAPAPSVDFGEDSGDDLPF